MFGRRWLLDVCDTPQRLLCSHGNHRERPDPLVMVASTLAPSHKAQQASGWPSQRLGILAWGIIRRDFVPPSAYSHCSQSVSGSYDGQWHTGPHSEKAQFTIEAEKDLSLPENMTRQAHCCHRFLLVRPRSFCLPLFVCMCACVCVWV